MLLIRIRVTKVDVNGFNGRDHLPDPADEGCEGFVTNIDLEPADYYAPSEPGETPPTMYAMTDGTYGPQVFYVRLDNGRCICLMGHEFQLLSCTNDGDL